MNLSSAAEKPDVVARQNQDRENRLTKLLAAKERKMVADSGK
jgi:hypothetical protein